MPVDPRLARVLGQQDDENDEAGGGIDQPEEEATPGGELLGRAGAESQPHHQPQIEAGDVDQVALLDVCPAAQVGPPETATIEGVREAALDPFGAQLQGFLGDPRAEPRPIAYTARCASRSPCQRWTPFGLGSAIRLRHGPLSRSFSVSRLW